jgi:hypothetical protein
MTGPQAVDRGDFAGEGDFVTVEQLAQLRQVTPAAIRAQLRSGSLPGEQVLQGQRTVWRIPVSAVRRYLDTAGSPPPTARPQPSAGPAPSPGAPSAPRPGPAAAPADPEPVPQGAGSVPAGGPTPLPAPLPSARVEVLESEVRRLRRQLSALAEAHRRLLDAVTADLDADR